MRAALSHALPLLVSINPMPLFPWAFSCMYGMTFLEILQKKTHASGSRVDLLYKVTVMVLVCVRNLLCAQQNFDAGSSSHNHLGMHYVSVPYVLGHAFMVSWYIQATLSMHLLICLSYCTFSFYMYVN